MTQQAQDSPVLHVATQCRAGDALDEITNIEMCRADDLEARSTEFADGACVVIAWSNATVARFNRRIRAALGRLSPMPEPGDRLVAIRGTIDGDFVNGDEMIVESVGARHEIFRALGAGKSAESITAELQWLVLSVQTISGRVSLDALVLLNGIESHGKAELDETERALFKLAST